MAAKVPPSPPRSARIRCCCNLLLIAIIGLLLDGSATSINGLPSNTVIRSDINSGLESGGSLLQIDIQLERFRLRDICNVAMTHNRNLRLYMDYGDAGLVHGFTHRRESRGADEVEVDGSQRTNGRKECTLELVTCPSCRIRVTKSMLNIAKRNCESSLPSHPNDDGDEEDSSADDSRLCKCNYISFVEPAFGAVRSGIQQRPERRICQAQQTAVQISNGRTMRIHFGLTEIGDGDSFNFTVVAERNLDEINGVPIDPRYLRSPNRPAGAVIVTPFFPASVPSDFIKQHLIRCTSPSSASSSSASSSALAAPYSACSIRILFTDFQIDAMSRVEFFNSDGDLIELLTGQMFRPAVVLSDGPSILMRFYANGGRAPMRYRAELDFLTRGGDLPSTAQHDDADDDDVLRPRTECGGIVDTLGGAITMMDMVGVANATTTMPQPQQRRYDCIWLVRPSERYANGRPYLSLRVHAFREFVTQSELSIHEGLTSVGPQVGVLQSNELNYRSVDAAATSKEYVVPAATGFYVRFQGVFSAAAKLSLVYTVFGYDAKSTAAMQFECRNHRLIPLQLQCDGFDHCGDNSDEPDSCMLVWKHETYDRRWYSHTPNYYFPKTVQYPDMRSATIVFLVSTGALVFLICGIVLLLYRMTNWARDHQPPQPHHYRSNGVGGSIGSSDLGDANHIMIIEDGDESGNSGLEDQHPPKYEAPPTYEDVLKVGLEEFCAAKVLALRECLKSVVVSAAGGVGGAAREMLDVVVAGGAAAQSDEESVTTTTVSNGSSVIEGIDCRNMALDTTAAECNLMTPASVDESSTTPCHVAVLDAMPSDDQNPSPDELTATTEPTAHGDATSSELWNALIIEPASEPLENIEELGICD